MQVQWCSSYMTVETLRSGDRECSVQDNRHEMVRDGAQADTRDLMAKNNSPVISWRNRDVQLDKKVLWLTQRVNMIKHVNHAIYSKNKGNVDL